jgi:uncharacterized Zn finger protein
MKCPYCGSHNVEEQDRTWRRIIMRCNECRHTWDCRPLWNGFNDDD